jgi:hypothetical protein
MGSAATAIKRCAWVSGADPLMLEYHDREWDVPVHDDRKHFEFLVLEAAQAGLSWANRWQTCPPLLGRAAACTNSPACGEHQR